MGGARGMNKKRCVLLAMCMVLKMTGQKKYSRLLMVRSVGNIKSVKPHGLHRRCGYSYLLSVRFTQSRPNALKRASDWGTPSAERLHRLTADYSLSSISISSYCGISRKLIFPPGKIPLGGCCLVKSSVFK